MQGISSLTVQHVMHFRRIYALTHIIFYLKYHENSCETINDRFLVQMQDRSAQWDMYRENSQIMIANFWAQNKPTYTKAYTMVKLNTCMQRTCYSGIKS